MNRPEPVLVIDLFEEEREHFLELLAVLGDEQWQAPTACPGWSVKDVAAHLLRGDISRLSRGRDGSESAPRPDESLGDLINRLNSEWVQAFRLTSPEVLCDLLRWSGPQTLDYFKSLDPFRLGEPVSWAGPDPAPIWLDLAREYTERWHHQQHIRDAVGIPGLGDVKFFAPVLRTFAWALPRAFRSVEADVGSAVTLTISGGSGGNWAVVRESHGWMLYDGTPPGPAAAVELGESTAWRLLTNGLPKIEAERRMKTKGDIRLARHVLEARAIIV